MPDALVRLKAALTARYAFERELGQGGMAFVYLARDLKHRRAVAVKVLRPELAAALGPERFLREIEIAARLTHPHVLPLYDSGEAEGVLYYVMPYVEGESLRDRLDREKQLPLEDGLRIAGEVASALAYAHSHDVVHRDIKPENILLAGGEAFVADFGIARAVTAAADERLTATGIAVGTPAYMSPEQAAGDRALDGRSDIYSLACVLYEMLAGQPPFTGPSTATIVHQHLTAPPPLVTRIRPAVPAAVARVIERALAKTPADRFAAAQQFAWELEAAGHARPQAAARRHRSPTLLHAATAGAVLVAFAWWAYARWHPTVAGPRHIELWGETYDRRPQDVLGLQSEVARAVARPVNLQAHRAYLLGRYFWNQRTPEGLAKAFQHFVQAIKLDSHYAAAYAGVADYYNVLPFYKRVSPLEVFPKAKAAAQQALALDDGVAEAHASLAYITAYYDWDWAGAEDDPLLWTPLRRRHAAAAGDAGARFDVRCGVLGSRAGL